MIKIIRGNLLEADIDIICHQVNCIGIMGGGLALQIKNKYPEVYKNYVNLCKGLNPQSLLGRTQIINCNDGKKIANLFSQLNFGTKQQHTDYEKLKECLSYVKVFSIQNKNSTAIPFGIGCGLGGGDWNIVQQIIEEVFFDYPIFIYKL